MRERKLTAADIEQKRQEAIERLKATCKASHLLTEDECVALPRVHDLH
jgi:hypothetical protein